MKFKIAVLLLITVLFSGCSRITRDIAQTLEDPTEPTKLAPETNDQIQQGFGVGYNDEVSLNPILQASSINLALSNILYEGLFEINESFEAVPVLCESITFNSNIYTITIKSGVSFHSGQILTASDVLYSLELAKYNSDSPYYTRMAIVRDITVLNDRQLQIELTRPHSTFETLLDIPIIRQDSGNDVFPDGTGGYKVSENTLIPFENYHNETEFYVDEIELTTVAQEDIFMYSFETGGISVTKAPRLTSSPTSFTGDVMLYKVPTTEMYYLDANTSVYPFDNPKVREALSYFIDRQSLCTTQLQECATPAVLPRFVHTEEEIDGSFDTQKGLELLAEAGIYDSDDDGMLDMAPLFGTNRIPFEPVISLNGDNSFKSSLADRIILELNSHGINAVANKMTNDVFTTAITSGNYEIYLGETALHADFDITPLTAPLGQMNYSGYNNEQLSSLIYNMQNATKDSLPEATSAFEEYFKTEMPFIPIAFELTQVVVRPGFSITPLPFNIVNGLY